MTTTTKKKTVLVVGATGQSGQAAVKALLDRGHRVRAMARKAYALTLDDPRLERVAADVLDREDVVDALEGVDAVVVTLGAPARDRRRIRTWGTEVVIDAMKAKGVRRLVVQSSLGVGESRAGLDLFTKYVVFPFWLEQAMLDHAGQEERVLASGLEWTVVRPPHLVPQRVGAVEHGFAMDAPPPAMKVGLPALGSFLADQVDGDAYIGRTVGICQG